MKEIIIVGGGASGLLASILIKKELGSLVNITILERLERTGKKILATGNGRCNFTNTFTTELKYNNPRFVKPALNQFNYQQTIDLFRELGLLHVVEDDGRVYPLSELATSVLDVLRNEIKRLDIQEKCNSEVRKITLKEEQRYIVETTRGFRFEADYIIMATGGKSNQILGSNGSGYNLLKNFKISCTNIIPGLVGIKTDLNQIKGLDGLRVNAKVKLLNRKTKRVDWEETGEVQFKSDGISGIVVMQASSQMARLSLSKNAHPQILMLDLLPQYLIEDLEHLLISRLPRLADFSNEALFTGIFHRLLGLTILKRARIDLSGYIKDLSHKDCSKLAHAIKYFEIDIKEPYPFDRSQVTVGGISTNEVQPESLELRKLAGVYLCGEILNIDGECGGYNLQWAWTSAYLVSQALIKRIRSS